MQTPIQVELVAPTVLARTGSDELVLGAVQSAFGVGGVVGGLLLSTWGGFKRRIHGVLLGFMGLGVLGQALFGVGQALPIWMAGAFMTAFFLPLINGSNQAIWQSKVEPDVQGRVFVARRIIAQVSGPISMLVAGVLADNLFEPAMQPGALLAGALGWLAGTGPGRAWACSWRSVASCPPARACGAISRLPCATSRRSYPTTRRKK